MKTEFRFIPEKLYVWNPIESDMDEVDSINDAIDYYKDYMEDGEIHPDIEGIIILREVGHIELTETGERTVIDGQDVPVCSTKIIVNNSQTLTQQERRDIAEKAIRDFADDYSTTESEIQKYLNITYPL